MSKKNREVNLFKEVYPPDELAMIFREASKSVADALSLEDKGWINMSSGTSIGIPANERINNLKQSRTYYTYDPLAKQAIRLWTDYTFGTGMKWNTDNDSAKKVMDSFWNAKTNQCCLSARGQRRSSDKLLVDGDIFFALFLGAKGESTIRWIDPLEITEIITDVDDVEDVRYYKREWNDAQGKPNTDYYRSTTNIKDKAALPQTGSAVTSTQEALVYHAAYNTISQRGNPLLLPALHWIEYYREFLASRIAIMIALAKFAWRSKVKGGSSAVSNIKAKTNDKEIAAGSHLVENMGVDTQPIKTDTGASNAYQDGKMIKYQICAAVGIPDQYFGDISGGSLATASTVELPMMKMFQSYQQVWSDIYQDIDEVVLEYNNVPPDKWVIDRDFPAIAPEDVAAAATALTQILNVMPELGTTDEVIQIALMTLGVNNTAEVLKKLSKVSQESGGNVDAELLRVVKQLKEVLKKKE